MKVLMQHVSGFARGRHLPKLGCAVFPSAMLQLNNVKYNFFELLVNQC